MLGERNEVLADGLPGLTVHRAGNGFLTVGGIKRYMDGALGSHTAWLLEPYDDIPDSTGLRVESDEAMHEVARLALDHGLQLCTHAIGDLANRETLDLYQRVVGARDDPSKLRWRIEHAQHLHPDDVHRFAELGVIAAMQPVHATSDGPWVPKRLGDGRSRQGAYAWRTLLDSGAVIAAGTDAPVEAVDPIANFEAAVSRRMPDGSAFYPEQVMTRAEALKAMTLDAAYAAFEDDIKGSLEVGKLADITVLSRDILAVPEGEIGSATVRYTIVGGTIRYAAP
jgi:predicted amidohydrolase YtcJ